MTHSLNTTARRNRHSSGGGADCERRRRRGLVVRALLTACIAFSIPAAARADAVTVGNVTAELVGETETIRPGSPFTVGVSLRPAPDWHTYWQNPGDSGLATTVEWKLPAGMTAGELEWPHPVRLGKSPLVTF